MEKTKQQQRNNVSFDMKCGADTMGFSSLGPLPCVLMVVATVIDGRGSCISVVCCDGPQYFQMNSFGCK